MPRADGRRSDASADSIMLQQLWIKVLQGKLSLNLDFKTSGEAMSMRMRLYNATRNAVAHPDEFPLLAQAREECEAAIEKARPKTIILRHKSKAPIMDAVRAALQSVGIDPEDVSYLSPHQRELEASEQRVMQRMEKEKFEAMQSSSTPSGATQPLLDRQMGPVISSDGQPLAHITSNPFYSRDKPDGGAAD